MQRAKSSRHVRAADTRWRIAAAQRERDDGVPDRKAPEDMRLPFDLPLKSAGYLDLHIEPRIGYVSWRALDIETGEVVRCAALKELLRWIAANVPRMIAARNFH